MVSTPVHAEQTLTFYPVGPVYEYRFKLLQLVLDETKRADGPATVKPLDGNVSQDRSFRMLDSGEVDIVALGTSGARESGWLPVRVDLLRGILGYRVFLINGTRQREFQAIRSLDGLRKLTAGFGAQWADFPILKASNLLVDGVTESDNLIRMLMQSRFDYFPRGINEAWVELEKNKTRYPDLAVERSLALYYPYPVYFFVKRGNTKLADRLRRGLDLALADGSFRKLFLVYHTAFIDEADIGHRRLFRLTNTQLPPGTPRVDTSWWLKDKP
jgi:hypothetical protein